MDTITFYISLGIILLLGVLIIARQNSKHKRNVNILKMTIESLGKKIETAPRARIFNTSDLTAQDAQKLSDWLAHGGVFPFKIVKEDPDEYIKQFFKEKEEYTDLALLQMAGSLIGLKILIKSGYRRAGKIVGVMSDNPKYGNKPTVIILFNNRRFTYNLQQKAIREDIISMYEAIVKPNRK